MDEGREQYSLPLMSLSNRSLAFGCFQRAVGMVMAEITELNGLAFLNFMIPICFVACSAEVMMISIDTVHSGVTVVLKQSGSLINTGSF